MIKMIKIPYQLQRPEFRFIKVKSQSKQPIELEWQKTKNYKFDDSELLEHIKKGGNYGVVCGEGNLIVLDCDDLRFAEEVIVKLPPTFVVETGRGGKHLYFISDCNENFVFQFGELRAKNMQVIGAGSVHPNGRIYKVEKNLPIARISQIRLKELLAPYIKQKEAVAGGKLDLETIKKIEGDEKAFNLFNGNISGYPTRSEAEQALVCKLILLGFDKKQIFGIMANSQLGKWSEAHLQYRELTYQKGVQLICDTTNLTVVEEKQEPLKILWDKDLANIETPKTKWLVEKLIPLSSIVFVGGKRGTYKTYFALHLAIAISSGKLALEEFITEKVPVLFIDEENAIETLKERFEGLKKGMGIIEKLPVAFISYEGLKLDKADWRKKLKGLFDEHKFKAVFVDSFRRVISFNENEAGEVSNFFSDALKPFSKEYGTTWILLHHLRKGIVGRNPTDEMDEIRGSSDISNYADVVLILHKPRSVENRFILKQLKCRRAKEMPSKVVELKWNADSLSMICLGDAEESLYADELVATAIMKWVAEEQQPAFETSEIFEALKSEKFSQPSIYRALKLLQQQEKIRKVKRGKYEISAKVNLKEYLQQKIKEKYPEGVPPGAGSLPIPPEPKIEDYE